jgi:hypothetical protein
LYYEISALYKRNLWITQKVWIFCDKNYNSLKIHWKIIHNRNRVSVLIVDLQEVGKIHQQNAKTLVRPDAPISCESAKGSFKNIHACRGERGLAAIEAHSKARQVEKL